ncbi:hypothetical protein [Bosea sp. TAB14]|uniref:hypothetical protein n=1 Tax=Bosea sp. TAB14 TaxID=3237481 RepID=UPI003F8EB3FA
MYQRFESFEPTFRTAIPVLVGLFIVILSAGAAIQTAALRDDALINATGEMEVISALIARELDNGTQSGREPTAVLATIASTSSARPSRSPCSATAPG